jgi:two-component system response regulator HydG
MRSYTRVEAVARTGQLLANLEGITFLEPTDLPDALQAEALTGRRLAALPITNEGRNLGMLLVSCQQSSLCEHCDLGFAEMILQQARGSLLRVFSHEEELRRLAEQAQTDAGLGGLVGKDPKMQSIFHMIHEVAPTDATVLILGESGTGKELAAQAIHQLSHRRDSPFVVINCSAYPATLLESELFGHEKGAFTGATRQKPGRFEQAQGGTVFLDEVGDIPLAAQTKLLRVLQTHRFERLGGVKTLDLDVRILAATNKDLLAEVKTGSFREDLYYRLSVFPLEMPPLRQRRNDIIILARHFLRLFSQELGKDVRGFSQEALQLIVDYHWPGNVRELENVVERALVLAKGGQVEDWDLPASLRGPSSMAGRTLDHHERELLVEALEQSSWNKKVAARNLGISRTTLYRKIKKHNLNEPTQH